MVAGATVAHGLKPSPRNDYCKKLIRKKIWRVGDKALGLTKYLTKLILVLLADAEMELILPPTATVFTLGTDDG
jgi:hypothetical protein